MNRDEKTTLACFLNLAEDYIKDGHTRKNDTPAQKSPEKDFSSLPLAYQIDEDELQCEPEDSSETLNDICAAIRTCKACDLAKTRKNTVPGEGSDHPLVMVVGEGPGEDEDNSGRPFVGRAGRLLDKMLQSIGLSRDKNCYIANMVKCRPPDNRDPEPGEMAACFHFLERQILNLKPRLILCAGRIAAQNLLKTNQGINALRGKFTELSIGEAGKEELVIPVLPTYHPSALLRNESMKRPAWEDLKLLKSRLDSLL